MTNLIVSDYIYIKYVYYKITKPQVKSALELSKQN